jgi:pentatricopeptide repeat protein
VQKALELLDELEDISPETECDLAPNTIVFNCVLNGLAMRRAANDAWSLFEEMKELKSLGYDSSPDAVSYACLARAVVGDRDSSRAMKRLNKIVSEAQEKVDNGILKPDTRLFNTLIKSYTGISKYEETAAKKADDVLSQMEMSTLGDKGISPDIQTYKHTCEACAMSKAAGAADMATKVFGKAQSHADQGLIDPINSDIVSYVALAHTRSKEEGASSPELLNTRAFNTLLAAHANRVGEGRLASVCRIFKILDEKYQSGQKNCEPDTSTYNWVSPDSDFISFLLHLDLILVVILPQMILTAVHSESESPDVNKIAFQVALKNFRTLHTYDTNARPDILTYEFFLRTCHKLLPTGDTRRNLVDKAFNLSCNHRLVTASICKEAAKSDLKLIQDKMGTEGKADGAVIIPDNWSEEVPHRMRSESVILGGESRWSYSKKN